MTASAVAVIAHASIAVVTAAPVVEVMVRTVLDFDR